ncbi:hypothetical protein VTH06DRAFT_3891 [Thermothelomyces fergusii]
MPPPKTVVIVGGSLAGLMHGLCLKRHGSHVIILEQDPGRVRSSHHAGIAFGPAVEEVLRKYDATGVQNCTPLVSTRIAWRKRPSFKEIRAVRHLTSWGLIYRILRANFDGLASAAVPRPPLPREGDGEAEYRPGHRVTGINYDRARGLVTVRFVGLDGAEGSLTADLVIGADGMHSTVRHLIGAPVVKEYSGYVAWRGTVAEGDLPPDVAEYFASRTCINLLGDTYIVSYAVPPESGSFAPGSRLINWVWYYNLPEGSDALAEVLTDTEGRLHTNTVPAGRVRPDVWRKHLAATLPAMAAPYAALLSATACPGSGSGSGDGGDSTTTTAAATKGGSSSSSGSAGVFVTRINDALSDQAAFFDGHVVLVGDALAGFRPHFAVAAEQAARHCLALARAWEQRRGGPGPVQQWAAEAVAYGRRTWLLSRLLGHFGLGRWSELGWTLVLYVACLARLALGRGPKGHDDGTAKERPLRLFNDVYSSRLENAASRYAPRAPFPRLPVELRLQIHLALDNEYPTHFLRGRGSPLTPQTLHPTAAESFADILRTSLRSVLCLVGFRYNTRG